MIYSKRVIGDLWKKIVQENERLGQEFTARGKLNTITGNWKLKTEPSLNKRTIPLFKLHRAL